jgi:hypothetical protein
MIMDYLHKYKYAFIILIVLTSFFLITKYLNSGSEKAEIIELNNTYSKIQLSDLVSGGPPKDGIPSIDNPKFVSIEDSEWIDDNSDIFLIIGENTIKAYPQPILVWHEIVNNEIDGVPVAITYCPLCGSTVAYKRVINDEPVEFGTTGLLYNSNLVMYDRKTKSYWTQIRGEAVIGELTGTKLEKIPLQTMKWKDAKIRFPQAEVLSKETGFSRSYGTDPYTDYYQREEILFPVKSAQSDYDLGAKTIIIGITINNDSRAYTEFDLLTQRNITDTLGGEIIELIKEPDGFMTITNKQTGDTIPWERDFWFAWLAFHPDTTVYSK